MTHANAPLTETGRLRLANVYRCHPFVVGGDTHARNHVYAILAARTGELIDTRDFPTTSAGIRRAIAWVACRTEADVDTLWVIEGAASYGAVLAGVVAAEGVPTAEASRMDAKKRRGVGKSDAIDACQIAAAALPLPLEKLRRPRVNDGVRQALRILITARDAMSTERTRSVNALTALLRTHVWDLTPGRLFQASKSLASRGGVPARRSFP